MSLLLTRDDGWQQDCSITVDDGHLHQPAPESSLPFEVGGKAPRDSVYPLVVQGGAGDTEEANFNSHLPVPDFRFA